MSFSTSHAISFSSPAKTWEEALPVGNGRLGGMVFGLPNTERIQLNEDSVWYGGPQDRNNPSALENLPKIRKLILEGKISEAQELCTFALSGIPEESRHYEPLGNLYIEFEGDETEFSDYSRELHLSTATVTTSFVLAGVKYTRQVIASYPKNALIIHLTADKPGALSFHAQLGRNPGKPWEEIPYQKQTLRRQAYTGFCDSITGKDGGIQIMEATAGGGGVHMACGIKVIAKGGRTTLIGNTTRIQNADEAVIILCADTTFREEDPVSSVLKRLEDVYSNRKDPAALDYLISEYEQVLYLLTAHTGQMIKDRTLRETIGIYNDHNAAMREFSEVSAGYPDVITPLIRHRVMKSAWFYEKAEHTAVIREITEELRKLPKKEFHGKKVVLTGILCEPEEILQMLWENNIAVVGDDLLQESMQYMCDTEPVRGRELKSLAEQWGKRSGCMLIYEPGKNRGRKLAELCRRTGADGVISSLVKFCDPDEYDQPYLKKDLEREGFPLLQIEVDQLRAGDEQIRTKIETFADLLDQR